MNAEEIDDAICEIMMRDGPDGHIDGHRTITEFIIALRDGEGEVWISDYLAARERP